MKTWADIIEAICFIVIVLILGLLFIAVLTEPLYAETVTIPPGLNYTRDTSGNMVFSCDPIVTRADGLAALRAVMVFADYDSLADKLVTAGIVSAGDAYVIATLEKGWTWTL